MKTAAAIILAFLLGAPLYAQETLITGDVAFGGFGGLTVQGMSVNKQFGVLVGAGGGVIIDHTIAIGAAAFGLANNVTPADPGNQNAVDISLAVS